MPQRRVVNINIRMTKDVKDSLEYITIRDSFSQGKAVDRALSLLEQQRPAWHDKRLCEADADECQCECRGYVRLGDAGKHQRIQMSPRAKKSGLFEQTMRHLEKGGGAVLALVVALLLFTSPAWTETEFKDSKDYGNCTTRTGVDVFTDEETYSVMCKMLVVSPTFKMDTISFIIIEGRLMGSFSIIRGGQGDLSHTGDTIPVTFRVDKRPVRKFSANWSGGNMAFVHDSDLAAALMGEIAQGKRVAIQIGYRTGIIPLKGSAAAVKDFWSRVQRRSDLTGNVKEIPVK